MSIRNATRRLAVAAAAAAALATVCTLSLAAPAFASSPASGTNCGTQAGGNGFPDCATPAESYTAGTPFSSGQYINVDVPANTVLTPGEGISILECEDPGGLAANDPTSISDCDGNTHQGDTVTVGTSSSPNGAGSVTYNANPTAGTGYQVYALPDTLIGDAADSPTVCNASNWCVLYIGPPQTSFSAPYYLSQPFLVNPTPGDTGADPGDGTPEAPLAIGLPLAGMAMMGGLTVMRRRRRSSASNA